MPNGTRRICSIEGCGRFVAGWGFCRLHYDRFMKHGDPFGIAQRRRRGRCEVAGCGNPHNARGMCTKHYMRWRTYGDPTHPSAYEMTITDKFWARVDLTDPLGCWLWRGATNGRYPVFPIGGHYAHRFAYELLVGPIPVGLTIDHLCRHPLCVRPDHLEPVTQAENNRRARVARVP